MVIKLNRSKISENSFYIDYSKVNNNLEINTEDMNISLNIRNASVVSDKKNLKLTIIANINVEIDYKGNDNNSFRSFITKLDLDYGLIVNAISHSRIKKQGASIN